SRFATGDALCDEATAWPVPPHGVPRGARPPRDLVAGADVLPRLDAGAAGVLERGPRLDLPLCGGHVGLGVEYDRDVGERNCHASLRGGDTSVVTVAPTQGLRNVSRLAGAALSLLLAAAPAPASDTPDLTCDQEPGIRFFWTEWGFCDLEPQVPDRPRGIVIWTHGIRGTNEQYTAPPAVALRLLHARGWDIVKINRHNLAESARASVVRATERTRS